MTDVPMCQECKKRPAEFFDDPDGDGYYMRCCPTCNERALERYMERREFAYYHSDEPPEQPA